MNTDVPSNASTVANSNFNSKLASGKNIKEIIIPNFAKSIVPAVVGATNLFWVNCCMINPHKLKLIPAMIMLNVLGNRLDNKTFN